APRRPARAARPHRAHRSALPARDPCRGAASGLKHRADGSLVTADGTTVASAIIGQPFTDDKGAALAQYFQSRPSAAGKGYDPTATAASNLGPESVVDTLPDPASKDDTGKQSLLT